MKDLSKYVDEDFLDLTKFSNCSSYIYYSKEKERYEINDYAKKNNKKIKIKLISSGAKDITIDKEKIKHVHSLFIEYKIINNIEDLVLINDLTLHKCENINDMNANILTQMKSLNLMYCPNVKDVGYLRNIKILRTREKVYGIHLLTNVREICIKKWYGMDRKQLSKLKKLMKINKKPLEIYIL